MKKWYVVHTQTGSEEKVKKSLETKITVNNAQELVSQILIPTEQVSEIRGGKRRILERKFFPGYILVEMELDEKTYFLVKSTPGVTGFIGLGKKASTLQDEEVQNILKRSQETHAKPSPKVIFEKGEQIRVVDGPFTNFSGTVEELHPEKGKLKASISIFGRSAPVELEYWQVEKV